MKSINIKLKIIEKGYTIKEIAEILGIHEQTISNWINGQNTDNISVFLKMMILLDIKTTDLISKQ